jgi:hypothetical protein
MQHFSARPSYHQAAKTIFKKKPQKTEYPSCFEGNISLPFKSVIETVRILGLENLG